MEFEEQGVKNYIHNVGRKMVNGFLAIFRGEVLAWFVLAFLTMVIYGISWIL